MIVFAIVITYNGKKWLDKCFGSLLMSSIPLEIIAIDNSSSDGTPDIIKENFPEVELIVSKTNLGFGQANNIGLKKALKEGADYVFLLNQDAWIQTDTIAKLVSIQLSSPEYGILSPLQLNGDGNDFDYLFKIYLAQSGHLTYSFDQYPVDSRNHILDMDMVNAAAWLISRPVLMQIGGFNPYFYHYGEDTEYLNRCIFHNIKVGAVPVTYINHDREQKNSATKEKRMWKRYIEIMFLHPANNLWPGFYLINIMKAISVNIYHCKFSEVLKIISTLIQITPKYLFLTICRLKLKNKFPHFIINN